MKSNVFVFLFLSALIPALVSSQGKMNTRKWRKTERDSMAKGQLFFDEGLNNLALPIFANLQKQHPNELYLKYVTAVTALGRGDWHSRSLSFLQEVYAKNKKVHNVEFYLAKASHLNYKLEDAVKYLDLFEQNEKKIDPPVKKEIPLLRNYIANAAKLMAAPKPATITNMGPPINTYNSEYVPVLSADESIMIFTYVGERSTGGLQNAFNEPDVYGIHYEDVFFSIK